MKKNAPNPISLVRSEVARARSKDYSISERERASRFRRGMSSALLKARSDLNENTYAKFMDETRRMSSLERARFARQPIGYDYLTLLIQPKRIPLGREILWLATTISANANIINDFTAFANVLASALFEGGPGNALDALDEIDDRIGVSLWSNELRVALIQRSLGEDAKKKYVSRIRSTYKKGMLPFLTTYFSQREEPNVTIGWFLDNVRRRIGNISNFDYREYALYKITKERPTNGTSLAAILRIEQNHHGIDIYETFVHILQHLVTNQRQLVRRAVLAKAIRRLDGISDFRLERIRSELGVCRCSYKTDDVAGKAIEAILSGDPKSGLILAKHRLREAPSSLPALVAACAARGCGRRRNPPHFRLRSVVASFVIGGLTQQLARTRDSDIKSTCSPDALSKFVYSFDGLPIARAIRTFIWLQRSPSHTGMLPLLNEVTLNSPYTLAPSRRVAEFMGLLRGNQIRRSSLLHMLPRSYALAAYHLQHGDSQSAAECISPALRSRSRLITSSASVLALEAYAESGELGLAAKLVSCECIQHGVDPMCLPVENIFKGVSWGAIRPFADDIAMSNSLFIYSQIAEDDKAMSYRAFALNTLLDSFHVDRPSMLPRNSCGVDRDEFGFFLGRACSQSIIDMLPALASTSAVLRERRDICATLINLELGPLDDYQQELVGLTRELSVQSGMQVYDGSRIHVDIDELRNALRRDFSESFQRYLAIGKNVAQSENFDSVLRSLTRGDESSKHLLSIPKEEADDLLLFMLIGARQRFLYDVPHGLDSYLSKRVRHGSVVGVIRAPVEKEFIITARDDQSKDYIPNRHWFANVDPATRRQLDLAFASFARTFDDHLIRLKNVLLQVRSEAHPLGIFDVPIQPPVYHLIKSVALRDRSIDSFVTTLVSAMWGLLNPSLQRAKEVLERDTLKVLTDALQTLRTKVYESVPDCPDRARFNSALGNAASSVEVAVKAVASWFEPVAPEDYMYSVQDMIDIAKASVQAINGMFQPNVDLVAPDSLDISAAALPVLIDIMFVAFGNAAKWSGIEGRVSMLVEVTHDEDKGVLRMRVENEVAPNVMTSLARQKIAEKKDEIEGRTYDRARSEGGSGLIKVASIVYQSTLGKLDFGFLGETRFFFEADLAFLSNRSSKDEDPAR